MFYRVGKVFIETLCRQPADFQFRLHHIKGMHIRVVNIQFCQNPAFLQIFYVGFRLIIKRLPVSHKGIRRWEMGVVGLPGRVMQTAAVSPPPALSPPTKI